MFKSKHIFNFILFFLFLIFFSVKSHSSEIKINSPNNEVTLKFDFDNGLIIFNVDSWKIRLSKGKKFWEKVKSNIKSNNPASIRYGIKTSNIYEFPKYFDWRWGSLVSIDGDEIIIKDENFFQEKELKDIESYLFFVVKSNAWYGYRLDWGGKSWSQAIINRINSKQAILKQKLEEEKMKKEAAEREEELIKQREQKLAREKEKKLAEERARKKKIAEQAIKEKARKKREALEKARNKKLAEQARKKKLEQDKITKKIRDYKRKASDFYNDIEGFVKSGGNVDLVKLYDFFDIKPNPRKNWNSSDLKNYENLRQFMNSVSEFVNYEKQRIGDRLKKTFALKDQSIETLKKNLDDLKSLMRKMFGSSDMPKIKTLIGEVEANLANFNQSKANKLIVKTTSYISSKLDKPKVVEKKDFPTDTPNLINVSWNKVKNDFTIQQRQFCQLTDSFFSDLENARKSKNEIKINMVHKERQSDLDALIPGGKINNWIFKVIKIDQVEDGSAAVVLSLQCKSFVGSGQIHTKSTWQSKSNKEWRATIPYDDRRYRELAKLSFGEFVVGSGVMLEIGAYKPGQKETFYASQQVGEHPLTKNLNLEGELFLVDLSYIVALN